MGAALVLAEAAGVPRALAHDVFESSAAAAPFVKHKRRAFEDPGSAGVAFRLALMEKDLNLIIALADSLGVPVEQSRTNRAVAAAAAESLGDHDMAAIATFLRERRAATNPR
jgi:3-hydroxyisobutyrate dehydrogenase-like beta-hydroxyacid dehydrogenase